MPPSVTCIKTPTSFTVSGPKGSKTIPIPPYLQVEESSPLRVSVLDPKVWRQRAEWGLFRALIANAVKGVSDGWEVEIKLVGVGYRFSSAPGVLQARLGYPKTLEWKLPEGVTIDLKSTTECILKGIDKQVLGQVAADVRRWRKPEPYNGKGVFVNGETIRRKVPGKK